jgi:hypothetical protein
MKNVPFEKMSKRQKKEYLKEHRLPLMPAPKRGNEVYEYKRKKEKLRCE